MGGVEALRAALADRYAIQREVGHGAMATVYLARDLRFARDVAIKVLSPDFSAALGAERFLREIDVVAKLNHPHILPLLDSGKAGGFLYYVMPYVEGSLRNRLVKETQLRIDEAIALTREIALALDYAHREGIVHRDVKPENILLSRGYALLGDFGIARVLSLADVERLTHTGASPGTPAYMSPEQCGGGGTLDGRSDLYSLGCVLYELLAGAPPFTGPNGQAIAARQLADPVPPLRTVRRTVSEGLERVVLRVLEKVPADRYQSGSELAAALAAPPVSIRSAWRRRVPLAAGITVALAIVWRVLAQSGTPLDRNRVVVFPLAETVSSRQQEATGYDVALMIESGLEHTEPLSWIDGWAQLEPDQRENMNLVTANMERRIARDRGARWTIAGVVSRRGDSATVVLRINDVAGDSVVRQTSVTRHASQIAQAGLEAINVLLPTILAPGRRIDLTALADRRPAAVASWLQGEREYRLGNFDTALVYLRRSVDEDSALAVAALRAAQAASWKGLFPEAKRFADLAFSHVALLPVRQGAFARGLAAYFRGDADSAVRWLKLALATSPDWTEAHMTLGEVYHHFLPSVPGALDSLAEAEFLAAAVDTGFAPPLFHLAEIAIRSGDADRAREAVQRFERFGGATQERRELTLMMSCVRAPHDVDWNAAVVVSPMEVLSAAKMLSIAGGFPGCVEDATRAILRAPTATNQHWGATIVLQDILAAKAKSQAIKHMVDSLRTPQFWQPTLFYVIDALAGVREFDSLVDESVAAMREAYGSKYEDSVSANTLLLLGTWYAQSGRIPDAERLQRIIARTASKGHNAIVELENDALTAHILLARGDSVRALDRFERLRPVSTQEDLQWGYAQSFPVENQVLAALLFARGRYQEAFDVSARFDHPTPTVYLPFLPTSLALRYRAALALSRPEQAKRLRRRLEALGRADLLNSPI